MKSIITAVVRDKGVSAEEIDRRLSVDALQVAVDLHRRVGGSDESFMQMARILLERVRE